MSSTPKVDLYNNAYGNNSEEVYRQVRLATYGEDLGQTSWVTTREMAEIPKLLGLTSSSNVLEIGSGSGGFTLQLAETIGCRILGIDINEAGIKTATELAASRKLDSLAKFALVDASQALPFQDATFDAVFSNDALCHVRKRHLLFGEIGRVLKMGGRFLFSDALVIGGMISHEEIAARSSIGYYLFSPPGENEKWLEARFRVVSVTDTTADASAIAQRWYAARLMRRDALVAIEGADNYAGLQRFLDCVETLTHKRSLLRLLYLAEKVR